MTTLTAPPTAPTISDPNSFDGRVDAYIQWIGTNVSEMNAFQAALTAIASGSAVSLPYTFSTTTTDSDPGNGFLRLDNATQNAATTIRLDTVDGESIDESALINTFDDSTSTIKGYIRLVKLGDASKWLLFSVSSLASPSGYKNITVVNVASSAATPFANNDAIILLFTRNGDKGDVGSGGSYDDATADLGVIAKPLAGTLTEKHCGLALFNSGAYTLPDLSTISGDIKFRLTCPNNASAPPSSVTTSDGWAITTGFAAGTYKEIMPTSTGTSHGTWDAAAMTPPTLGTITGSAANTVTGTANLDTNYDVVLFHDASNWYVAAINNSTGSVGAAATLAAYNSENYSAIFKDTTSTFVAFVQHNVGGSTVRAGSVDTGTLVITLGSAQTNANVFVDTPVKLAGGTYLMSLDTTNDLKACTVSSTTVTMGTAVASGAQSTGVGNLKTLRSSNTEAFIAYLATGGGTSSTRQMACRVASISGTTITLNTASGAATNVCRTGEIRALIAYNEGASYVAVAMDGTTATTGNFYGMTASGTTATIGTISARTNSLPAQFAAQTWTHQKKQQIKAYNTSTMVFGHLAAGPIVATISGSTLTWGSSGGPASVCDFLVDATAGTSFYAVGASAFDKITISGTTVSSSWQVAVSPTIVISDTLTDKAASYSGTWYKWTLPTMSAAITPTKWLYASGNNLVFCGTIS